MNNAKGFVVRAEESRIATHFTMKGVTSNRLDLKIASSDTEGGLSVWVQNGHSPHGGPPLHLHPNQDEFFFVLEGRYQFRVGDDYYMLEAGDTIFLPRNIPHAFIQLTHQARMLLAYQPAGMMEDFFRKTAAINTALTKEEVAALFAEHDMQVVGPPLQYNGNE